jgi:hypothetical protein
MIIDYRALISRKAPIVAVVGIVVISAAVISVMVVPDHAIVAEARIVPEARLVLASPLPIFALSLTAEPVVLDIVISAFSQPLPVIRIVVSVIAA